MEILSNDLGVNVDHFNIRPILDFNDTEEVTEGETKEPVVDKTATRRTRFGRNDLNDPMRLVKDVLCSMCGANVRHSFPIDNFGSSSGLGLFCRPLCARRFNGSGLNIIDSSNYVVILTELTLGRSVECVARTQNVSPAVVESIKISEYARTANNYGTKMVG